MTGRGSDDADAREFAPVERVLRSAAGEFESLYPQTPDLAGAVRRRLAARRAVPWGLLHLPRAAAVALAVLVLVALALLVPGVRTALARFLGLDTVRVIPVATVPAPIATPDARLAGLTTLERAQADARIAIRLPAGQGTPLRVYLQRFSFGEQVILVYPGFVLYEADSLVYMKMVNDGTIVRELTVQGRPALWLSGAEHLLQIHAPDGTLQLESERIVTGNVLAWEDGDVTYRLETSLSLDEAVGIAQSLP